MKTREQQLAFLYEKLEKIRFGMLSTIDPDTGVIHSRPMTNRQIDHDGTLWFIASDETATILDLDRDEHVNVSYSDASANVFISISGLAHVIRDSAKVHELWHSLDKAWFPGGEDDPHIVLIRVDITAAEYWDSPSNRVAELYELTKSIAAGKPAYDMSEHAKLGKL